MGIFDVLKKQLVAVIDWTESEQGVLAWRYPMADREIMNGASLTVRETQAAMFVNEGEVADLFGPGRYTLTTQNLPILTSLRNWERGFQSPFKSDVYFFSLREQTDQRWGTQQPVTIRDKEFGPIRLRAFGTYSYRVQSPKAFFKKLSGTSDLYATSDLEAQLRAMIMTSMASFFGSSEVAFLDMAGNQAKFSDTIKGALLKPFSDYGLELASFYVQSVSLPEELQQYLDKSSQMHLVGDLQKYAQFQAADSIASAASNPGGIAGAGVGLSAGMAVGQAMAGALGGQAAHGAAGQPGSADEALAMIDKLHELLTKGVITQTEFDAKKAELLKKIT